MLGDLEALLSAEKNAAELEGLNVEGQTNFFRTELVVKTHLSR